ncbi:MAG TPA: DapH/DapD/GlmU-related protein [Xanthobacteraceae bacterium]
MDYEETCLRNGLAVVAIIKNFEGQSFASDVEKVVEVSLAGRELFRHSVAIPLFTPGHRRAALEQVISFGATRFDPLLDRTAVLPSSLSVDRGVFVNAGAIVGAASALREFSIVNRGAVLGHHVELGPFASIGPGVVTGGQVTIGRGAVLGAGAVVLPQISVGANAVVGAGAVVTQDVEAGTLVVGNPAHVRKRGIVGYNGLSA